MSKRIASFAEFWPYYISEHRVPADRWLHFAGSTFFLGTLLVHAVAAPLRVIPLVAVALLIGWAAWTVEAKRSAAPALLAMIALMVAASPTLLVGVVGAYGCAWVGHFVIEKNRPATFVYPLWSLAGDFRMYGQMLRGRLWAGDGSEIAPR